MGADDFLHSASRADCVSLNPAEDYLDEETT
jgi:hypothetical protein